MKNFYAEKIDRIYSYIKAGKNKKIAIKDLSSFAEISADHIQQIFQAFTGETMYEAALRIKMEEAASQLSENPSIKIKDAAALAGCADSAEFSRIFKEHFSVSPSAWKKEKTAAVTADEPHQKPPAVAALSSEVKVIEGFSAAYIKHTGIYAGDTSLFIYLYNKLTSWAASQSLLDTRYENIVVYHDPAEIIRDTRPRLSLGITIPETTAVGGDIGKMDIPGGQYLICRYCLRENEYSEAWRQTYSFLLKDHRTEPADGPRFEIYPADIQSGDKYSSIADLCIPVKSAVSSGA